MWVNIIAGGWTALAAVLALWPVRVVHRADTKPAPRAIAYKVFRASLVSASPAG